MIAGRYSYDDRLRRREELVSATWREGRSDPRVANELDGFLTAASQRLGEEGALNASRAATTGRRMELPGVGREHQAGLHELARSFIQAREGDDAQQGLGSARRARSAEGREVAGAAGGAGAQGLTREPEQDRERQREERGLGLGR